MDYNDILKICQGFNSMADILIILMKFQQEANDLGDETFWVFNKDLATKANCDLRMVNLSIAHLWKLGFIDLIRQDEKTGELQGEYRVHLDKIQQSIDELPK